MKAIDFTTFGDPDVLKLVDVDPPEVRQNDLLVRVHAAGVNRADLLLRTGHYGRPDFGDSRLIGLEVAGEVVAVGDGVKGFAVGDRIMGITGGGAYAELARLHAARDTTSAALEVRTRTAELFTERFQHGLETIGSVRQVEARRAGTHAELLALNGRYAHMWQLQQQGGQHAGAPAADPATLGDSAFEQAFSAK